MIPAFIKSICLYGKNRKNHKLITTQFTDKFCLISNTVRNCELISQICERQPQIFPKSSFVFPKVRRHFTQNVQKCLCCLCREFQKPNERVMLFLWAILSVQFQDKISLKSLYWKLFGERYIQTDEHTNMRLT